MSVIIGFQGNPGSYGHGLSLGVQSTLRERGSSETELTHFQTFPELFDALGTGAVDVANVPVENNTMHVVQKPMDLLVGGEYRIIHDWYYPVNHALLGHASLKDGHGLEGVIVHSQQPALDQCLPFIEQRGLVMKPESDTALSAELVAELSGDDQYEHVAIASIGAGHLHGLTVLEEGIQEKKNNTTRFLTIRKSGHSRIADNYLQTVDRDYFKITYAVWAKESEIVSLCTELALRGYQLDRINNRPAKTKISNSSVFDRVHLLDFTISATADRNPAEVKKYFENHTIGYHFLGCYAYSKMPEHRLE